METTKTIFVVRHGQRCDIVHPDLRYEYPNPMDSKLTTLGIYQSQRTKLLISHFSAPEVSVKVVASPFLGCIETALEINKEVTLDWRFSDFLHILNYPDDITQSISCVTPWFANNYFVPTLIGQPPKYQESYLDMKNRVLEGMTDWLSRLEQDVLVIVTHLMPLEILSQTMKGEDIKLTDDGFCCVTMAQYSQNKFQVVLLADHTHAPQYLKS
jgi:broad specificity phosphatase PhoE